jgi:hypothetical protein
MSVKVTIRVSRSTSNRALSQTAPKTGADSASALTEIAALDSTSSFSQLSSWGWYMVTIASPARISCGQSQLSSSCARAPYGGRRQRDAVSSAHGAVPPGVFHVSLQLPSLITTAYHQRDRHSHRVAIPLNGNPG